MRIVNLLSLPHRLISANCSELTMLTHGFFRGLLKLYGGGRKGPNVYGTRPVPRWTPTSIGPAQTFSSPLSPGVDKGAVTNPRFSNSLQRHSRPCPQDPRRLGVVRLTQRVRIPC